MTTVCARCNDRERGDLDLPVGWIEVGEGVYLCPDCLANIEYSIRATNRTGRTELAAMVTALHFAYGDEGAAVISLVVAVKLVRGLGGYTRLIPVGRLFVSEEWR